MRHWDLRTGSRRGEVALRPSLPLILQIVQALCGAYQRGEWFATSISTFRQAIQLPLQGLEPIRAVICNRVNIALDLRVTFNDHMSQI